jgi:hypothetical protein
MGDAPGQELVPGLLDEAKPLADVVEKMVKVYHRGLTLKPP